jgi:hypothetical protein
MGHHKHEKKETAVQYPGGWSYPSPVSVNGQMMSDGMIWTGDHPVTEEQMAELTETRGHETSIDSLTKVGRWHPNYDTFYHVHNQSAPRQGGIGSFAYETQKCGKGVVFTKTGIMFHHRNGKYKFGVPHNGAYHHRMAGDGQEDFAGPEPGSEAEKLLGDGEYFWDNGHQWYDIRGKSAAPIGKLVHGDDKSRGKHRRSTDSTETEHFGHRRKTD